MNGILARQPEGRVEVSGQVLLGVQRLDRLARHGRERSVALCPRDCPRLSRHAPSLRARPGSRSRGPAADRHGVGGRGSRVGRVSRMQSGVLRRAGSSSSASRCARGSCPGSRSARCCTCRSGTSPASRLRAASAPSPLPGAVARATSTTSSSSGQLTYDGGPVLHASAPYLIFWTPVGQSLPAGTQSLLTRYFTDVAADSGTSANVYGVSRQYYRRLRIRRLSPDLLQRAGHRRRRSLPAPGTASTARTSPPAIRAASPTPSSRPRSST